jgi:hypothetical protein
VEVATVVYNNDFRHFHAVCSRKIDQIPQMFPQNQKSTPPQPDKPRRRRIKIQKI